MMVCDLCLVVVGALLVLVCFFSCFCLFCFSFSCGVLFVDVCLFRVGCKLLVGGCLLFVVCCSLFVDC